MNKKNLIILLVLSLSLTARTQNVDKCRDIVRLTIQSVNKQSITDIEKYLSSDFEIANQKGKSAKLTLKQLVSQLNDSIVGYQEKEVTKNDTIISFNYNLKYQKSGDKQASFVFNKENKIKKLELLKIEIKQLETSENEVQYPSNNLIQVPFKLYGKLIGINILVNGEKQLFILDTGAPQIILNAHYFKEESDNKSKELSSNTTNGVNGQIKNMSIYKMKKLNVFGIEYHNHDFITMDLSHLEKKFEQKIYGLIGYKTIEKYDILFDYKKKEIVLIKPEYFKQYKQNNKLSIIRKIPIKLKRHIPIINAMINNSVYSFGIDSGAEANLLDIKLFDKFKNNLKRIKKDTLSGADKNKKEVISTKLKKMYVACKKYKNMKTVFNDISPFTKGYQIEINGLLGYEFLSKRKTLISFARKELVLVK